MINKRIEILRNYIEIIDFLLYLNKEFKQNLLMKKKITINDMRRLVKNEKIKNELELDKEFLETEILKIELVDIINNSK